MNHIALMLSPRLTAITHNANVPSATTNAHMPIEIGLGSGRLMLVAIPNNPPELARTLP